MGTIQHDCVVAVLVDYGLLGDGSYKRAAERLELLREKMREYGDDKNDYSIYLIGPISMVNGCFFWSFAPDGSKEFWEWSNECEKLRQEFFDICNTVNNCDVISLSFGEYDGLKINYPQQHINGKLDGDYENCGFDGEGGFKVEFNDYNKKEKNE